MIILRRMTQRGYQSKISCDKVLIYSAEAGACFCLWPRVIRVLCCVFSCFRVAGFGCSFCQINGWLENKRRFVEGAFLPHGDSLRRAVTMLPPWPCLCVHSEFPHLYKDSIISESFPPRLCSKVFKWTSRLYMFPSRKSNETLQKGTALWWLDWLVVVYNHKVVSLSDSGNPGANYC